MLARGYALVAACYADISPDPDPASPEEQDEYAYRRCFELWPNDYETSAIGSRLGYVRRNQQHGHSAFDWIWMMDFGDRVFKERK